jgi:CRISPR-associated protein Cas1
MQIVINSYGSYLRKKGECFEIKIDDKKTEISARKIQSILISTSTLVSTDAIFLAHENNIDIHIRNTFYDKLRGA